MSAPFQFGAQLFEVVDLAIENDPDGFLLIRHRLMTAGQIDDGKPSKTQADRAGDEVALIVGATMGDRSRHPPDRLGLHRFVSREIKLAGYAAHRAVVGRPKTEDRRLTSLLTELFRLCHHSSEHLTDSQTLL